MVVEAPARERWRRDGACCERNGETPGDWSAPEFLELESPVWIINIHFPLVHGSGCFTTRPAYCWQFMALLSPSRFNFMVFLRHE
jgi:hypothetical protein